MGHGDARSNYFKKEEIGTCATCSASRGGWTGPGGVFFCFECWLPYVRKNSPTQDLSQWFPARLLEAEASAAPTNGSSAKADVVPAETAPASKARDDEQQQQLQPLPFPITETLPEEIRILTCSFDGTAKIWCPTSRRCLYTFAGHDEAVMSAVFSKDGARLLTAGYDGLAKIWCVATGACLQVFDGRPVAFSEFVGLYSAVFSADNSKILTACADGGARIWRVADSTCEWAVHGHHDKYMRLAVFSPTETHVLTSSADETVKLWDIASKSLERCFSGHRGWVNTAVFSPDGSSILTASADYTARLWEVESGRCIGVLQGHTRYVRAAVFAPGDCVLTCSSDWSAKLWSIATCVCLRTFTGHDFWVNSAVASADGSLLLTASRDHTTKIFRTDNGECLSTCGSTWTEDKSTGEHVNFVAAASFVPPAALRVLLTRTDGAAGTSSSSSPAEGLEDGGPAASETQPPASA